MDVFREEFCPNLVTGAEGWSAQQGETSLDSRVGPENDDEADSFMPPPPPRAPAVGSQIRAGSSSQLRAGSSGSKRKRKEIEKATENCSTRNTLLSRKNDLVERMLEREDNSSVVRVVEILNDLPGVRKWSRFHKASIDHLLADVANRDGFVAFSSVENKISYLEHRTGINFDE